MARVSYVVTLLLLVAPPAGAQEEQDDLAVAPFNSPDRMIGKLGERFGSVVVVQGIVVEGYRKTEGDRRLLRIQRVNDRATQKHIEIELSGREVSSLHFGDSYEFEGYETGEFVGTPREVYAAAVRAGTPFQTFTFHFRHRLIVLASVRIAPIEWSPSDFIDREALISGRAVSDNGGSFIVGSDWKLLVSADQQWPERFIEKLVEGRGMIRETGERNTYQLERGTAQLVRLEDQVGQRVALRGKTRRLNGTWLFRYRGVDVHIEGLAELPGIQLGIGDAVQIEGILHHETLPSTGRASDADAPLEQRFIIREASCRPVDALLSPEYGDP